MKVSTRAFIFLALLSISTCFAQSHKTTKIYGKIVDSLMQPLSYANIIAIPEDQNLNVVYDISDDNGKYQLNLIVNNTYEITVSYLGYHSKKIKITKDSKNIEKVFILKENINQLKTVELSYTPPISIKKDTITYNTDKFTTGEERKLREVLKKLPGVEVDRAGNVKVQGRNITKVLVENKTFFTGDSKLAVNNIPADAVDKIEILDNYNEVAMLKGLQDSDEIAMNIKLKKDKKKFIFGDIEIGAGIKEKHIIHPNLFYYSPKTNINLIGDLNNTGNKSFTFSDYIAFEGGFGKLMNDANSYLNLFNSDFAQFLINRNYKSNKNTFGAFNFRQSLNNVTDLSTYIITSISDINTENETFYEYLLEDPIIETRTTKGKADSFFTIGKIKLDYKPSYETDITFNSFIKFTNNEFRGNSLTQSADLSNQIFTNKNIDGLNFKQNLSISKKLNKKHTATFNATYHFQNDKPITNWITNKQILQGLIPLETNDIYDILQTQKSKLHFANTIIKDYWVLNNFNHLYTSIGVNIASNNFYSKDIQQLSNGIINDFSNNNFGNDFKYDFLNAFLGVEYKFQIGIATFKPALFYHYYNWSTQQLENKESNTKWVALPQFTSKIELNNSEKISVKYRLNTRFPAVNRLANNFLLTSFNQVFKGNESLENQLYHTFSLKYYKFSLFRNLNINAGFNLNKKVQHFKNVTQLNGIEQFNTQVMFEEPEYTTSINGSIAKKINKIKLRLESRFDYGDFYQIVNSLTNLNIYKTFSNTISTETFFKSFPNFELGYTKDFNNYRSFGNNNKFENDQLFINIEYDFLEDFIFKTYYSYDSYKNKDLKTRNTFDNANTSLFYQKENSPWGFEISISNVFNTKFRQQNSFSNFLISDSKTYILPRIFLFKISYKL